MADLYTDLLIRIGRRDRERDVYPLEVSLDGEPLSAAGMMHARPEDLRDPGGDPSEYGYVLFDALLVGRVRRVYDEAVARAERETGGRLRFRLWIGDGLPELRTVAWERLYHRYGGQDLPLVASTNRPFSRYASRGPAEVGPVPGQIRMLFAVANPEELPEGLAEIPVEEEVEALANALSTAAGRRFGGTVLAGRTGLSPGLGQRLRDLGFEVVGGPTSLGAIQHHLPNHHLFHFVGHGRLGPGRDPGGVQPPRLDGEPRPQTTILYLESDGDHDGPVSGSQLAQALPHPRPRLVFLGACESARQELPGAEAKVPFLALGPGLAEAGVPAVVAMQGLVNIEAARRLTFDFYRRLAEHGVVDLALNEARAPLFVQGRRDWAIPVLFMRLADGQLFVPQVDIPLDERPYKGLSPYQARDAHLFKGRARLSGQVADAVREQAITVLHGEAGAGLTSLWEAGVRPLLQAEDDVVVRVDEYGDLAAELRAELRNEMRPRRLRLEADATLAEVLQAAGAQATGRLVVVLDQFERALELPAVDRGQMATALQASLEGVGTRLRLIFMLNSDYKGQLAELQAKLPGLAPPWLQVAVLDGAGAQEAIVQPLEDLDWPAQLEPEFARSQIVVDLHGLSGSHRTGPGAGDGRDELWVDPGYLQIVCSRLYELARRRNPPAINRALYAEVAGGAEGILARYVEEVLDDHLGADRDAAEQILIAMAASDAELRVSAADLVTEGVPRERVELILEKLVEADLLARRPAEGGPRYAFANPIVAREARKLGGQSLLDRERAGDELERAWRMWLLAEGTKEDRHRALPEVAQLRFLSESGAHLRPDPQKALLVLRAAVVRGELAMQPWLGWLRTASGTTLVEAIEAGGPTGSEVLTEAVAHRARLVLGLEGGQAVEDETYGTLARAAAVAPGGDVRRTAALALTALDPLQEGGSKGGLKECPARLEAALGAEVPGWKRWWRKAELWATLTEADPAFERLGRRLGPLEGLGAWIWRVWRRLVYDRQRIGRLTAGGALGAGLGLAAIRTLTARLAGQTWTLQLGAGIWWGLLLGAGLMLGIMLAEALTLGSKGASDMVWRRMAKAAWSVLLGAVGFGLGHLLVGSAAGYLNSSAMLLVNLAALCTGLGLSLGHASLSWEGGEGRLWRWPLRLLVVVVWSLVGQALIYWAGSEWTTAVGFSLSDYRFMAGAIPWRMWGELVAAAPRAVGLADAALTGLFLYGGSVLGARLAGRKTGRGA